MGNAWTHEHDLTYKRRSSTRFTRDALADLLVHFVKAAPASGEASPPASGAWGRPTIVNNVETLCNVRHIMEMVVMPFLKLASQTTRALESGVFPGMFGILVISNSNAAL